MTDPTPRDDRRPAAGGPVMGDHPELETDEVERVAPPRKPDRLSPLLVAAIVALVVLVAVIIIWVT